MPKQVYHIKAFEGGINKKADPRDIEDNQLVEVTNASVSNVGRITMPGNGKSAFVTVNAENVLVSPTSSEDNQNRFHKETPIASGHGLFSFTHDYNFDNTNSLIEPRELNTEFICINDGADIDIWTDIAGLQYGNWKDSLISMGVVHNTGSDGASEDIADIKGVKPVYYKADNGLRVCDGNFGEEIVERAMVSGINLTVSGTSLTTDAGKFKNSDVGTYIKIDSEVMKITAYSAGTGSDSNDVLTVERARFNTVAETHDADSGNKDIIKINVPKVLTHIKRPMLKKTGANVNINRWVQDIQTPEAPKRGALKVFSSPILGNDGAATPSLTSSSIFPTEPEVVNIGLQHIISTDDTDIYLHNTQIVAESGTSTQTILTLTLAEADNSVLEDISSFSIGKFISISGCTGDGVALNGVHEIVGFGSSTGQIKIEGDSAIIGYTPNSGECEVVLEDEIMDDNLKRKYILGMSYLYDGGGSEMQESSVTTGLLCSTIPNYLIDNANAYFDLAGTNWKTSDSSFGNIQNFSSSETNNWDKIAVYNAKTDSTGSDTLFYDAGVNVVSATKKYKIATKVSGISGGATLKYYIGRGAGATDLTTGMTEGTHFKTINANGTYIFELTCPSSPNQQIPLAIQAASASAGVRVHFAIVYEFVEDTIMSNSNALDFRVAQSIIKSQISFLCNNSRTGVFNATTQNNSWNERIEGFRIYMKEIDIIGDGLADEWVMLYDVNLKEGTYVMHAKDSDVEDLRLGDISGNEWSASETSDNYAVVTSNLLGDSLKSLPLLTYESENGYKFDTNLAARYKCATVIDRKVYIGNLKIGDKTFPDRMLRSDTDRFDTFPDDGTHFIDVATSDGESIVALESVGDKLIQYKEKTAYVIRVTSEGEELINTFSGAGVKNPCQIAKSNEGIYWVNSNGIYYYDGEKLSNVSKDRFNINNWITNEEFKKPVIVGYDKYSNKIIILTTNVSGAESSGYIYDIANASITQHDNLFNWYSIATSSDIIIGNTESEL